MKDHADKGQGGEGQRASGENLSRRGFVKSLAAAGAGIAAPAVVPASALGGNGEVPPSERITIGAIGLDGRGKTDLKHFLTKKDVQCAAVCDCFKKRRQQALKIVKRRQDRGKCKAYRFHEKVLERDDIDAVVLATGTRWHTVLSCLAAQAGKDVYCEKPFCLTVGEGRELVNTMKRYGTVWQCGTQRRSNASYQSVVEMVHRGDIGELQTIKTFLGGAWKQNGLAKPQPSPDPATFDYERWLGQSPWAPYSPVRVRLWRMNWDTGGGVVPDMGAHYFDLAQWAHDRELTGPVEYEGSAQWPDHGFSEVPQTVDVRARYEDGVEIHITNGPDGPKLPGAPGYLQGKAVRFIGDAGQIQIDERSVIRTKPQSLRQRAVGGKSWSYMAGHVRNFLDCIKSRRRTNSYPELAQRGHTIAHCTNICLRLGRTLEWDYENEEFVDDREANNLLKRTRRAPWRI